MIYWTDYDWLLLKSKPYKYKKQWYDDNFYALDIEVSSGIYRNGKVIKTYENWTKEKNAGIGVCLPYIWQFGINDTVVYGREFSELNSFIDILNNHITCTPIIWTHNMSYEFQFMLNIDRPTKLFARKPHRLIYTECDRYMHRCTWQLTRLSLADWGEQTGGTKKAIGDLDYSELYTPKSILPQKALDYSEKDIIVMWEGIQRYKEKYGHYAAIPLTQTGEVRKQIRDLYKGDTKNAIHMTNLLPRDKAEYERFKCLVSGGISHANYWKVDKIYHNVKSFDITSSYPYCMCAYKFPCARFRRMYDTGDWKKYIYDDDKCAYVRVKFTNLRAKIDNHYLSAHKYVDRGRRISVDNGRIMTADMFELYLTDVDMQMVLLSYDFDAVDIKELYVANADYLDKNLVELILTRFGEKTSLKGIEEFEGLYLQAKQFVNAIYGMELTDIVQADINFNVDTGEWKEIESKTIDEILNDKRNKWYNNFNAYVHGIWTVAFARRSLWLAVIEMDSDVIYYDTDSVKFTGDYSRFFERYNDERFNTLKNALRAHGIDIARAQPKTVKGETVTLGKFDYEETYKSFKTLGSKRYAYINEGDELHITVAGVNKKKGSGAFKNLKEFKIGKKIEHKYCKRLQAQYVDNMPTVIWNKGKYDEYECNLKYGIVMSPSTYEMTRAQDFSDLLNLAVRGY